MGPNIYQQINAPEPILEPNCKLLHGLRISHVQLVEINGLETLCLQNLQCSLSSGLITSSEDRAESLPGELTNNLVADALVASRYHRYCGF